ncbi:MAG: DUF4271 domain-containing protein [Chitinophagaceae bacterium]|nr:MAG: DUF4271 domain-containing protein [Chitinophagaceae bacterium]
MHVLKILLPLLVCCFVLGSGLRAQSQNDSVNKVPPTPVQQAPALQRAQPTPAELQRKKQADSVRAITQAAEAKIAAELARVAAVKQRDDSLKVASDSIARLDSLETIRINKATVARITAVQTFLKQHKQFRFGAAPLQMRLQERKPRSNDILFYTLCGLVLYFAILKLAFNKYLNNLFTLFFRVTMRQNQIRDQLLQAPLPSLLLNILFALSAGMYLNLVLFHFDMQPDPSFWVSFSWCVAIVSLLYLGKMLILTMMGWIFNVSNATNTYLFIVFLVNKMIGMFLLPFLFILAFPHPAIISGMITLSFILVIALFFYRFIISYRPIRSEINVGRLHFIIYLCAFEIAPLLLIYKVLLIFLERNN